MLLFRPHHSNSRTAGRYALRGNFGEQARRVAGISLIVGILFFLAWQIFAKTMAASYQSADAERALTWDPHLPVALIRLAESRISSSPAPGNAMALAQARELAQRALRFDPLAPFALTDLGLIAEREGDSSRAVTLMKLAGELKLRDETAQGWLVNEALNRSDFGDALYRLDIIMRTHPEAVDENSSLLVALASEPPTMPLIARMIGTNPPWRARFLNTVPSKMNNEIALQRFYAELQTEPHPLSPKEIQPYLDRLVKDGFVKAANAIWTAMLPPDRADAETLYNGGFQYQLSGSEFDWEIEQSSGADIKIVAGGEAKASTLRIEFSGSRVDFHNVTHLLALPPGIYRLTGEVEAESLQTERGLWWRVSCLGPGPNLGQTELVMESEPWRAFRLLFTVPSANCEAQALRLELPARIPTEQAIAGVVQFRNLAITPAQAATDGP